MKKVIAAATAFSALTFGVGCSSPEHSNGPTPTTVSADVLASRKPFADQLWKRAFSVFLDKLNTHQATLDVEKQSCLVYEEPEGSILTKNPGTFFYETPDAHIAFQVYGTGNAQHHTIFYGPYIYIDSQLKQSGITDQAPTIGHFGPRQQVNIAITGMDGDGRTFWFNGADGTRIDETMIVEHLPTGAIDTDKVNQAARSLCGATLDLVPIPPSTIPQPGHQSNST